MSSVTHNDYADEKSDIIPSGNVESLLATLDGRVAAVNKQVHEFEQKIEAILEVPSPEEVKGLTTPNARCALGARIQNVLDEVNAISRHLDSITNRVAL